MARLAVARHDWLPENGADPRRDLTFVAGATLCVLSDAPGGGWLTGRAAAPLKKLDGKPGDPQLEQPVGIFPACMVELELGGATCKITAASHNGWGTGTLRSGRAYWFPRADPTRIQFTVPTMTAAGGGRRGGQQAVVARHAWNEETGADPRTDAAFEAGDELLVSTGPGQWWATARAAGQAHERAVKTLLDSGANARLPDSAGLTPLMAVAVLAARPPSAEERAAVADETHGLTTLALRRRAARAGVPAERLEAAADEGVAHAKGATLDLLQRALSAARGDTAALPLLRLLLARGAGVDIDNVRGSDGATAFHLVCAHGLPGCIEALVQAGCDVRKRNAAGMTGRQLAEERAPTTLGLQRLRGCVPLLSSRASLHTAVSLADPSTELDQDHQQAAKHADWPKKLETRLQRDLVAAARRGDGVAIGRLLDGDCEVNSLLSTKHLPDDGSGSRNWGWGHETTALLAAILRTPSGIFPASLLPVPLAPSARPDRVKPVQLAFLRRGENAHKAARTTGLLDEDDQGCAEGMCSFCHVEGRKDVPVFQGSTCCVELPHRRRRG